MPLQRSHESPERATLHRRAADIAREADTDAAPTPHPLVTLGGQVGNAHVARMLAQREGAPEEEEQVQAQHDVAMRAGVGAEHAPPQAQRESDGAPQPEVGLAGGPLSDGLAGRINSRRGAGASLDGGTRAAMEGSFGTSFADVRVHTDAESDALNRSISAKAFTTGSDIFFRKDASPGDHSLLAHELTHVVQQRSGGGGGGMSVGPAGDSHEQQADAVSAAVTSGAAAHAQREADEAQRTAVQREDAAPEEEEQAAG